MRAIIAVALGILWLWPWLAMLAQMVWALATGQSLWPVLDRLDKLGGILLFGFIAWPLIVSALVIVGAMTWGFLGDLSERRKEEKS